MWSSHDEPGPPAIRGPTDLSFEARQSLVVQKWDEFRAALKDLIVTKHLGGVLEAYMKITNEVHSQLISC